MNRSQRRAAGYRNPKNSRGKSKADGFEMWTVTRGFEVSSQLFSSRDAAEKVAFRMKADYPLMDWGVAKAIIVITERLSLNDKMEAQSRLLLPTPPKTNG